MFTVMKVCRVNCKDMYYDKLQFFVTLKKYSSCKSMKEFLANNHQNLRNLHYNLVECNAMNQTGFLEKIW